MTPAASLADHARGGVTPSAYALGEVKRIETRTVAGLDIGQKQDHTALTVIERRTLTYEGRSAVTWEPLTRVEYVMTHLERLPLGLPHPAMVEQVRTRLLLVPPDSPMTLVVDATGVGGPVVDLLRARGLGRGLMPVTITGGLGVNQGPDGYRVPKRDLITGLQVAFETRVLEIAAGVGAAVEALIGELMAMRCAVNENGHERFGVWREGLHDDLVLATALGWWGMQRRASLDVFARSSFPDVPQ